MGYTRLFDWSADVEADISIHMWKIEWILGPPCSSNIPSVEMNPSSSSHKRLLTAVLSFPFLKFIWLMMLNHSKSTLGWYIIFQKSLLIFGYCFSYYWFDDTTEYDVIYSDNCLFSNANGCLKTFCTVTLILYSPIFSTVNSWLVTLRRQNRWIIRKWSGYY